MRRIKKLILPLTASAFALLLAACQSPIEQKEISYVPDSYWTLMQDKLKTVKNLNLKGRIGIQNPQGRMSANYIYNLKNESYSLELISSLGSQIGKLTADKDKAMLIVNGKVYTSHDGEALIKEIYGLSLPVNNLKDIMLGIPQGMALKDASGKYQSAVIAGFLVEYQKFADFNDYALPTDYQISNEDTLLKVRLNEVLTIN
ncbi:lipoprotein insertase outer membrane protein LolB [Succinatimonas hippei]|uniref:lipoprotein insertase outer membrane protein LolB n=1 Tax=Succinatimonas hippei TaxID=626938 RepID=UPI0026EA196A|nr:lipoprotein insertase outer membrane protein LolB [Succinatimonas hippei]